jgi:cation diffusion facilitator family transporter
MNSNLANTARAKAQIKEGLVSIIVNAVLFALKFWVGLVTGSIALIADSWHTLSDSLSSIVVVLTPKFSGRKADKEHPFGHGRWEHIASIFIAFLLGIIAFGFFTDSIERLQTGESVSFGALAIAVTAFSIVVKELLAQYAFYLARKTGSLIIKADGWHHRSDSLSSVVVLIGIVASMIFGDRIWWIDSALGIFCALAIFYAAFEIVKEAITKLLGEQPKPDLVEKIKAEIKNIHSQELYIHHLHLHNYVLHQELTLHIRLPGNLSIDEGHVTATAIEKMLLEKFDMTATVHVEPLPPKELS